MRFKTTQPLGKILKSHGKVGELIISSYQELPERFYRMESIFIAIHEEGVPFFLQHIRKKTPTTAIVKLEDVDTLEEANGLTGLEWYMPGEEPDSKMPGTDDLTGFILVDQNDEEIGAVEDFTDIPNNTLLQVKYSGRLVDIPFNRETIHYIDPENKIIKNDIPEGLLDL